MNRIAFALSLIGGTFVTITALATDPLVVDLWPGKTPGDVGIEGQEGTRIYQSALLGGPTKLITNVTKPTLTIYQPPPDKNTGTAMLICPGGGYHNLFWELEGEEVAAWLNSQGMTGIILKYRCPRRPGDVMGEPPLGPLLDAQRAVSLVRSRAKEWGIDPQRIGMVGFSAGGDLSLRTATSFEKRTYEPIDAVDEVSCRPDFAVLCYSGYLKAKDKDEIAAGLRIPAQTPPIFLAHTTDDSISDAEHSVFMYLALKRAKIPAELHVYATGEHDFGVRQNEKLPSSWTKLCLNWLRNQSLLTPESSHTFYAPTTISNEAQAAVAQFSRTTRSASLPAADDLDGWKKVQAEVEEKRAAVNAAVVKQYQPDIEERTLGGVPVLDIKPLGWKSSNRVLVYTHGGAYTMYSAKSRLMSAVPMASDTGLRVVSVDYTLAPQAKWNEVTDQVVAVLQALLADERTWNDIAIYGESAGGGLAAGAVLKMRDQGSGMPAAVVLWSPWSDITDTGDSYATLQDSDPLLYYPANLKHCADAYASPADQKHPYVSPVYGDYSKGFPPTLIQAGTKEIFLSNAVRQYQALDTAGIPVKLDLYEGMWHIFQVFNRDLPESKLARKKVRVFLESHLGK